MDSVDARLNPLLTHDFDQFARLASRNTAQGGNSYDADGNFLVASANYDLITALYGVRRLHGTAVEQDKARVAKLLCNSAARAKASHFQKEIKTHRKQ
jgi:hypothetical protein